ncbi:MAG: hypothetical protein AUG49_20290 [Catenulispora sp. 13_1_20CM_3_70_7]|nr:MAG: hypothetical protein AUG49_20290 [Catenulispora sp. 13_1_20CM_3_70_7]
MPNTDSTWQVTRTFFPLFTRQCELDRVRTVAIVGAADGKFVLPLARAGTRVTAIDCDRDALDGLRHRLAVEGLTKRVEIISGDVLGLINFVVHDAVWTSCSWHYSRNHRRPLKEFVNALEQLCAPHGLFGAEYMMPIKPRQQHIEHYLPEGRIRAYMPDWHPIWETYTPVFNEAPHPGQPEPHQHRMGLFIGRRITAHATDRY